MWICYISYFQISFSTASSTAFHAYLSSSRCYHTGANIQFNQVLVNTYNRYNVHTGIFTVLYTGYYVFTWTVAAEHKSWFSAELRVNGALRGTVMADSDVGGRASGIHPATGFVITRVTCNQHVYIRFVSGSGCTLKSDSRTRATFSGWRMYWAMQKLEMETSVYQSTWKTL
jgi:hypothetical protein